jgi:cytochrome P450
MWGCAFLGSSLVTLVPLEDVPRAAVLIRVMGHFVGTPFNKELMEKAAEALLELREMINKWTNEHWAPQSQSNSEGGAQTQLFPHWLNNEVFESREEFESNVVMLLFAATHNLENVLGNAVRLLLQHEDQLEKIRADNSLLDPAVEEILRFCPAIRTVPRTAREDIEFDSGLMIQKGQTVILSIFDANRDPTIWENPNTFDITRNVDENSKHLTFGFGIHLCVGNAIARLQVRLVIENILLKRYPHARLVDSGHVPDWEHTYSTLESLPLYTNAATDETRE